LSAAEIEAKFGENVQAMLGPARAGELLQAIYALPGAANVNLMSALLHA